MRGTFSAKRAAVAGIGSLIVAVALSCYDGVTHAQVDQTAHADAPRSPIGRGETANAHYVGGASCAQCHAGISSIQPATAMGQAATNPSRTPTAIDYSPMQYKTGHYTFTLNRQGNELTASVTDGKDSLSAPVAWVFGRGVMGQTFILERDGTYYESKASYYSTIGNLDLTIGHSRQVPANLLQALGRPLPRAEVDQCFSCHTSEDVTKGKLILDKVHPGVTCENCHGPGSEHIGAAGRSRVQETKSHDIFNPGSLAPADLNDFCGSCHRTTRDVLASGIRDIRNIRFQPYRLESSRCYDPTDPRITCIACHDPHRPLETSAVSYDAKCLACHQKTASMAGHRMARVCPKATRECVSCHMPKLSLPGAHYAFTDHFIRVNHPQEPYPD